MCVLRREFEYFENLGGLTKPDDGDQATLDGLQDNVSGDSELVYFGKGHLGKML